VRWDYGRHALSLTARIGATLPIIESAAGQVFLAHLPDAMTASALERQYGRLTARQLADVEQIKARVRRRGFAEVKGGLITGQMSYAVLVASATEPMPLVATMVVPMDVVDEVVAINAPRALIKCAAEIVAELGGPGTKPR